MLVPGRWRTGHAAAVQGASAGRRKSKRGIRTAAAEQYRGGMAAKMSHGAVNGWAWGVRA